MGYHSVTSNSIQLQSANRKYKKSRLYSLWLIVIGNIFNYFEWIQRESFRNDEISLSPSWSDLQRNFAPKFSKISDCWIIWILCRDTIWFPVSAESVSAGSDTSSWVLLTAKSSVRFERNACNLSQGMVVMASVRVKQTYGANFLTLLNLDWT